MAAVAFIGLNEAAPLVLQVGSNPAPPDHLGAAEMFELVTSREFRYISTANLTLNCVDGRVGTHSGNYSGLVGWSKEAFPFDFHHPIEWSVMMTHWERGIEMPPETHLEQKGDECVEFGIFTRFRVGDFGSVGLSLLLGATTWFDLGTPVFGWVPWFYHILGAKVCCDGTYEAALVCSSFPNTAFYIDERKVETHDPFAAAQNPWLSVMLQWVHFPAGADIMDSMGSVMVYKGNLLTGEGPTKV